MKVLQRFSDMKLGQGFICEDQDTHMYKVSPTEGVDYYFPGIRHQVENKVYTLDPSVSVVIQHSPTGVEKAALMLLNIALHQLHHQYIVHPGLRAWMKALLSDPGEMRDITEYILEQPEVYEDCRDRGFYCPTEPYDTGILKNIIDPTPEGYRRDDDEGEGDEWEDDAWTDRIVFRLADAVRDYRINGRPGGDLTGFGGIRLRSLTHLEAAIAAYHRNREHYLMKCWRDEREERRKAEKQLKEQTRGQA